MAKCCLLFIGNAQTSEVNETVLPKMKKRLFVVQKESQELPWYVLLVPCSKESHTGKVEQPGFGFGVRVGVGVSFQLPRPPTV